MGLFKKIFRGIGKGFKAVAKTTTKVVKGAAKAVYNVQKKIVNGVLNNAIPIAANLVLPGVGGAVSGAVGKVLGSKAGDVVGKLIGNAGAAVGGTSGGRVAELAADENVKEGLEGYAGSGKATPAAAVTSVLSGNEASDALRLLSRDMSAIRATATTATSDGIPLTAAEIGSMVAAVSEDGVIKLEKIEKTLKTKMPNATTEQISAMAVRVAEVMSSSSGMAYKVDDTKAVGDVSSKFRFSDIGKYAIPAFAVLALGWLFMKK